jgi:LysM repeat protein
LSYRIFIALVIAGVLLCAPVFITAQDVTTPEIPSGLTIHVVQRGENLFRIALNYGMTTQELADLNGILDVNNIQVGQRLLVPSATSTSSIPQTHTVQPGETLSTIAQLYNVDVAMLLELNNLPNANQIYPGQVLTIAGVIEPNATPSIAAETTPEATTEAEIALIPTPAPSVVIADNGLRTLSSNLHTVRSGETLYRIALQYGLTTSELASANSISDPTLIFVGQQLIIPGVSNSPEAALDLPEPVTALDVNPLIFTEGETGVITLTTGVSSVVTGQFLGREITHSTLCLCRFRCLQMKVSTP